MSAGAKALGRQWCKYWRSSVCWVPWWRKEWLRTEIYFIFNKISIFNIELSKDYLLKIKNIIDWSWHQTSIFNHQLLLETQDHYLSSTLFILWRSNNFWSELTSSRAYRNCQYCTLKYHVSNKTFLLYLNKIDK